MSKSTYRIWGKKHTKQDTKGGLTLFELANLFRKRRIWGVFIYILFLCTL